MNFTRLTYLIWAIADLFFAIAFFSERAALALPFLIAPIVFCIFLAFFQNPQQFMRIWSGWLFQSLKFSFLIIGGYIFLRVGRFPVLNDFLVQVSERPWVSEIGGIEGISFVLLSTFAQICFIAGILFNLFRFFAPYKFGVDVKDYILSFEKSVLFAILTTLVLSFGLFSLPSLLGK